MTLRLSQTLAIAITLIAGIVLTGCRSPDYTGTWQGQTSQGKVISFTITNKNWITRAKLECDYQCQQSGFCPAVGTFEGDVTATVQGNTFTASLSTATFSGKFDSATTASGDLKVNTNSQQCGECKAAVTWSAKKL
jgi:hypothetical protein